MKNSNQSAVYKGSNWIASNGQMYGTNISNMVTLTDDST